MLLRRLGSALLGIALAAAPALAQNLLVNGSFEVPGYPPGANWPVPVTGETIAPDSGFEVWDNLEGHAANGAQHLELDVNTCDTIAQTIPTNSASDYLVRFAFGARNGVADNRVVVSWNGQQVDATSADGSGQTQIVWTYATFLVHGGAGSSTFEIANVGTCDGLGALLDDVSVVDQGIRIPTLDALGLALLAGALGLAALFARRRRTA